ESLIIEAPAVMLERIETEVQDKRLLISAGGGILKKIGDTFRTSFTRKKIKYHLTVKELIGIEINGLIKAEVNTINSNYFILKFKGVGSIKINHIDVRFLDVKLSNLGKIEMAGVVEEQKVTIKGSGNYQASNLKSDKAKVTINGLGKAVVWVNEEFEASIKGVGNISYYGNPRIKSTIASMASFTSLGKK
ncbi:MAG: GIN domain-containing protein, partial [Candidatus Heimdallarchaeota archaeon]